MPFSQALSANERMLLEHELMQLAQAQANQQALTRRNFFPAAARLSLTPPPDSSARDVLLGLGNFSSSLPSAVPPTVTALDTAAAMLMARSQSMSGRSNLPSALGLGLSGTLGLSRTSLNFPFANHPSMTHPDIGALRFECLRAERELSERRRVLELHIRAQAAAAAQQQRTVTTAASVESVRSDPKVPQTRVPQQVPQAHPPSESEGLKKLLLLQNAASSVKEDSASSSGDEEQEDWSDRSSNTSGSHQRWEQRQGEDSQEKDETAHEDKESKRSVFAPNRKRRVTKEKKTKHEAGQKNKSKWNSYFEMLKAYKNEYGDCCVPRGFSENPKLASWVAEQRKQYKLFISKKPNSITTERIKQLESLDFAWRQQEVAWERHKQQLADYYREYGHCSVPLNHHRYPGLGNWIKQQRRLYKRKRSGLADNQLPDERIQALTELGFDWNSTCKRKAAMVTSSPGFAKHKAAHKKQKPVVTTTFMRPVRELPVATRAPDRSNSNDSLPLKKRRRIDAVEV